LTDVSSEAHRDPSTAVASSLREAATSLSMPALTRRFVAESRDFREDVQRIGGLVEEIEAIADPAVRATTKQLVQSLMDLHGAALEKALDIVAEGGEPGMATIDRLGRDALVSSVLILYGLHPDDIETRVTRAVDRVRPQLRKQGCEVELLAVNDGAIRLRVETGSHTCGSTAKTVQATLEGAIYDAAPDMNSLVIEGFEEKPSSGFVALDKLMVSPVALEPQRAD
jgi:Fe-S cluster biogenesis protein NfuA